MPQPMPGSIDNLVELLKYFYNLGINGKEVDPRFFKQEAAHWLNTNVHNHVGSNAGTIVQARDVGSVSM